MFSDILDWKHHDHVFASVMLNYLGLSGVFTIYAIGCAVSWIFVFLKVPETKGMPLEVITEVLICGFHE
ncbi:hypothetical protein OIU78_020718 [Salix suchowensis]|nr:hypothetical protein OIU78_020718 [Salix suchowensis]